MLPAPKKWRAKGDPAGIDKSVRFRRTLRLPRSAQAEANRLLDRACADFLDQLPAPVSSRKSIKTIDLDVVDEFGNGDGAVVGPEAYQITISSDSVKIIGTDGPALRLALVTLGRMLVRRDGRTSLPQGRLTDWPDLPMRGFHVDLVCQSLRFEYLCDLLTRLAAAKFNTVLLEWGDKFPYQGHQVLSHPDAYIREEVCDLLALADSLGLVVVPLVQTLTHAEFILRHGQFAHLAEVPGNVYQLATDNPESIVLAKQLVDQLIESHPNSPYIHLGGDEPLGQSTTGEQVSLKGRGLIWVEYMNVICRHVQARGRTPVVRDDALLSHPQALTRFTRDCLLMHSQPEAQGFVAGACRLGGVDRTNLLSLEPSVRLQYAPFWSLHGARPPKTFYAMAPIAYLQDAGFGVIVAPTVRGCGDGYGAVRLRPHIVNCQVLARAAVEHNCLGMIVTSSSARRSPTETTVPALLAAAEAAWNARSASARELESRLAADIAGGRADLIGLLDSLGRTEPVMFNGIDSRGGWDNRKGAWSIAPLSSRVRRAGLGGLTAASESVRGVRSTVGDARKAAARLARMTAPDHLGQRFLPALRYAAREASHKAAQWLFLWQVARFARVDRGSAATLARQGATLLEEIRRCQREFKRAVGPTISSAALEEEYEIRFGSEARLIRRAVKLLRSRATRSRIRAELSDLLCLSPDPPIK